MAMFTSYRWTSHLFALRSKEISTPYVLQLLLDTGPAHDQLGRDVAERAEAAAPGIAAVHMDGILDSFADRVSALLVAASLGFAVVTLVLAAFGRRHPGPACSLAGRRSPVAGRIAGWRVHDGAWQGRVVVTGADGAATWMYPRQLTAPKPSLTWAGVVGLGKGVLGGVAFLCTAWASVWFQLHIVIATAYADVIVEASAANGQPTAGLEASVAIENSVNSLQGQLRAAFISCAALVISVTGLFASRSSGSTQQVLMHSFSARGSLGTLADACWADGHWRGRVDYRSRVGIPVHFWVRMSELSPADDP